MFKMLSLDYLSKKYVMLIQYVADALWSVIVCSVSAGFDCLAWHPEEIKASWKRSGRRSVMCLSVARPSSRLAHSLITIRAISDDSHTKWSWQQEPVNLSKVLIWLLSHQHLCSYGGGEPFDRMKKTNGSSVK